jgi:virulence-associated protein VapD
MGVWWLVGIYAVRLMEITKDTKVSDILEEYGDIADVMEVFGIKRVGGYSIRKYITRALTVERAAKVHRVPLDEFLETLQNAVTQMPNSETI